MNNKNYEAICIMFAELKEKLESLSEDLTSKPQDDSKMSKIQSLIENINLSNAGNGNGETILENIQIDFRKAFEHLAALVEKKEDNRVVNHVHSIRIQSIKVCIVIGVLYILLMVSVYFNFS